jgi:O-antigen ligase
MVISRIGERGGQQRFSWQHLAPLIFLVALPFNHNMALRLLALFLAGVFAIRLAYTNKTQLPLKLPLALWAGIAALSLNWSIDPLFSLGELKSEIGYGLVAFFSFYILNQGEREWKWSLQAIAVGMVATVAVALWVNRAHLPDFHTYNWDWQHGYVAYSTYLATILPCLMYIWIKNARGGALRILSWLLLPIFLLAGYATLNRMFWLSASSVFLLWAGLWWARHGQARRRTSMLVSTLGGALLLAALFITVANQKPADTAPLQADTSLFSGHILNTFENSERYDIWRFWLTRVAEKPLTGVGFGRDLPQLAYADIKPKEWHPLMFAHAHNVLLNYALQLGIGGLAALLFLLGALALRFWRLYRSPLEEASLLGICGMTTIIAMLSKNMTDDLFWRGDALLFWALMGMMLGYGHYLEKAKQ